MEEKGLMLNCYSIPRSIRICTYLSDVYTKYSDRGLICQATTRAALCSVGKVFYLVVWLHSQEIPTI